MPSVRCFHQQQFYAFEMQERGYYAEKRKRSESLRDEWLSLQEHTDNHDEGAMAQRIRIRVWAAVSCAV